MTAPNVTKWTLTTDPLITRRMGKTGEECAELLAVTTRIQIQGIDETDPGSKKTNRQRLIEEIGDVYAQLDADVAMLGLDREFIEDRRARKLGYMHEWETLYGAPTWVAPEAAALLHPDHIRAERRACMFGDVIENHTYAMQAAVIEQYAGVGAEKAMAWILNTLAGPGHMPDLDAAVALPAAKEVGPAQAWFDMKMAEHDAFRAAHPMPDAPAKGAVNG